MRNLLQDQFINKIIDEMSVENMIGQLMTFTTKPVEEFDKLAKKIRPGGIYFGTPVDKETVDQYTQIVNNHSGIPVIVAGDVENGPGCVLKGETYLPYAMAWGACDDEKLIERAAVATGEICRKNGIHLAYAPVVDILYNKDNPVVSVRAVSDKPEQVAKIAGAFVKGIQKNGMMMAVCKHFPGDGMDDRNQHFCPTVNRMTKEEWMNTYGYVYKKMIELGAASIMVAHIALPWIGEEKDPVLGEKPATLSYKIITELLKGELGYEGCIMSDAMCMVGTSAMCPPEKLCVEFIKAGGDMLVCPTEKDFDYLLAAVKCGELPLERVRDAVKRVLNLKMQAGLFENQEKLVSEIIVSEDIAALSDEIAEKSITLIRNTQNLIPLSIKKGGKFLLVNLQRNRDDIKDPAYMADIECLARELENRGYVADTLKTMNHYEVNKIKNDYDCILINCRVDPYSYLGGTLRINWDNIMTFWRGAVVNHPCVIFTSFGDPYKLYEFPFLRTYINAYSAAKQTMCALVKVILGEKPALGKSPVALEEFFEREV